MLAHLVRYNLRPLINKERLALSTISVMCRAQRLARADVDLSDYKSCCDMYRQSGDLRAVAERLMDRALHMKLGVDDRLVLQLSTVVVVCETLEGIFMDNVDLAGRILSKQKRPRPAYFDVPDPVDACPICCQGDRKGSWVQCADCDQAPVCSECAERMVVCPYCRSDTSFGPPKKINESL